MLQDMVGSITRKASSDLLDEAYTLQPFSRGDLLREAYTPQPYNIPNWINQGEQKPNWLGVGIASVIVIGFLVWAIKKQR